MNIDLKKLSIWLGTIVAILASLTALKGYIPYAYAEDVKQIESKVNTLEDVAKSIKIEMELERLERKAARITDEDRELTNIEQETLAEIKKQIDTLEKQLDE